MSRCRWRRCDAPATSTMTVAAPGYRWNGAVLAPGETFDLCERHVIELRETADERDLPDGCGPLHDSLHLPFDYVEQLRAGHRRTVTG